MDRHELLTQINETSFVVNDLTLYLDTHPTDEQALDQFAEAHQKRRTLLEEYQQKFEPLTIDCLRFDSHNEDNSFCAYPGQRHFHWTDGPTPWEGGHI